MIQIIQFRGQDHGLLPVIRQQAADTDTHILKTAGSIQTRCDRECEVRCHEVAVIAFPQSQKGQQTGAAQPLSDTFYPLLYQDTIIGVERNEVGHRTQGHQVQ